LADAMEEGVGEDRGAGAGLHVAGAASIDLPVDQFAAPGILGPAGAVAYREHVDMAVQDQVLARLRAVEGGDEVGHRGLRRDHAELEALAAQEIADETGGLRRIARRIRALAADEAAEERDDALAFLLDPLQQRLAVFAHLAPSPAVARASALPPRGAGCRCGASR